MPQFDNECFDSNLEFCYGIDKLLRSEVPKELFEYVANPTSTYELKILPKSDARTSHSSQSAAEPTTVTSSSSSHFPVFLCHPRHHFHGPLFRRLPYRIQLIQLNDVSAEADFVINKIPGNFDL